MKDILTVIAMMASLVLGLKFIVLPTKSESEEEIILVNYTGNVPLFIQKDELKWRN